MQATFKDTNNTTLKDYTINQSLQVIFKTNLSSLYDKNMKLYNRLWTRKKNKKKNKRKNRRKMVIDRK